MTLESFATKLDISKQHLSDIEKGKKSVSPERAARFSKLVHLKTNNELNSLPIVIHNCSAE